MTHDLYHFFSCVGMWLRIPNGYDLIFHLPGVKNRKEAWRGRDSGLSRKASTMF